MKTFYTFLLGVCAIAIALVSCKKSSTPEHEKTKSETVIENLTVELAKQPEVAAFSEAFKNISLSEEEVKDGLTILAPTDEALKSYRPNTVSYSKNSAKILVDTNAQKLTQERLKDHIVRGVLAKTDLTDGKVFTSLSGKVLKVTVDGQEIKINGVTLTFVSSSDSQMIYTISQVLTITDSKIYLPVKFTYAVDTFLSYQNITYVENTQLISSIEEGMLKREFIYHGDKLQKVIRYQKDMVAKEWRKIYEDIYELNSNGDVDRINTKRASNGENSSYQLFTYNSQRLTSVQYYTYRTLEFAEHTYTNSYEYDIFGNIKKLIESRPGSDALIVNFEYDNKNGIYKYVKNQGGNLNKNNNVIKNSVNHPNAVLFSNTYLEYNSAGYPVKYIATSSTTPVTTTVTVEYIEQ